VPTTVFDQLDREWQHLATSVAFTASLSRWAASEPALARFTDCADIARFTTTAAPGPVDEVLAALARVAAMDALAARVLLQLLLPGCRAVARRLATLECDPQERAAVVVAAAYARIRTYPAASRPAAIAPNIVLDTAKTARRWLRRSDAAEPIDSVVNLADTPTEVEAHPAVELLAILADAVRAEVIDADAARVVALSRISDQPITRLATERRCHPGSLRRRRHAAELALGAVA